MKYMKFSFLILLLTVNVIFNGCRPEAKENTVEKVMENGVEVVVNHLEPYEVSNAENELSLDQLFTIDMESESILKMGLTNIRAFDIDSDGNIFIFQSPETDAPLVFEFGAAGNFKNSFGKMGQGPEEIQYPHYLGLNHRDEIVMIEGAEKKLLFFTRKGELIRKKDLEFIYRPQRGFFLLSNGGFLVHHVPLSPSGTADRIAVSIFDSELRQIRTLAEYPFPGSGPEKMSVFLDQVPVIGLSESSIYLGYGEKNEDIHVYDLNGELKQKIRKEHKRIPVPDDLEERLTERLSGNPIRKHLFIPQYMPYFQYFFTDDDEHLYAVTSEKNEAGTNICDIYNPDGVFIEKKALGYFDLLMFIYMNEPLDIIAKHGRLYCMRIKESGFEELIVSEMLWE